MLRSQRVYRRLVFVPPPSCPLLKVWSFPRRLWKQCIGVKDPQTLR
jgi:hypothetical protein